MVPLCLLTWRLPDHRLDPDPNRPGPSPPPAQTGGRSLRLPVLAARLLLPPAPGVARPRTWRISPRSSSSICWRGLAGEGRSGTGIVRFPAHAPAELPRRPAERTPPAREETVRMPVPLPRWPHARGRAERTICPSIRLARQLDEKKDHSASIIHHKVSSAGLTSGAARERRLRRSGGGVHRSTGHGPQADATGGRDAAPAAAAATRWRRLLPATVVLAAGG